MTAKLVVQPIDVNFSLKNKIYEALRESIISMDIYAADTDPRLDERQLSEDLGVSRTPVREALARLEQEGFVRTVPRKGVFVVRKTKREILEMITAWAALESMAARLATEHASKQEIANLRSMFSTFQNNQAEAKIDEYSEANIQFHQEILKMSHTALIPKMAENLLIHVGAIRKRTITEGDRASRSIIDHMHIIEALEARNTDLAERLVREHALSLVTHVEKNVDYLD